MFAGNDDVFLTPAGKLSRVPVKSCGSSGMDGEMECSRRLAVRRIRAGRSEGSPLSHLVRVDAGRGQDFQCAFDLLGRYA